MRRRQMKTLAWDDIGKRIEFTGSRGRHVDGVLRSFTHGVFSHHGKGEYDVPRVLVTVYAGHSHEAHWTDPESTARIHPLAEIGLTTPEVERVECPACHGDGATYEQVRVGQHATPFVCDQCRGDGDIPLAEVGLTTKETNR